jgi:hypothetical protein
VVPDKYRPAPSGVTKSCANTCLLGCKKTARLCKMLCCAYWNKVPGTSQHAVHQGRVWVWVSWGPLRCKSSARRLMDAHKVS